jgi:pyruvate-formate lyase-activating enzyme
MSQTPDLNQLFQSAQNEGILSAASLQALNVQDIGAQIQAGLGIQIDDVTASEVVLVTLMPDDSGSISYAGNDAIVRAGHNTVIDALLSSNQKDNILVHNRYLNGQVLYPYCPVTQAVRMDAKNYNPNQGTPLYDQTIVLLGTVLAKAQEFSDNGVPVRTVTLIITDGADAHSKRATAKTVKSLVQDMLRTENHIIATMGINDGSTNFQQVFRDMGIRDEWILTPGNGQKEIRQAFQLFSQSAVRASQSAGSFGQTSLGGFGTP